RGGAGPRDRRSAAAGRTGPDRREDRSVQLRRDAARRARVNMVEPLVIDGARVAAEDGGTFEVCDPSSGDRLATVAKATKGGGDRGGPAPQRARGSKGRGG